MMEQTPPSTWLLIALATSVLACTGDSPSVTTAAGTDAPSGTDDNPSGLDSDAGGPSSSDGPLPMTTSTSSSTSPTEPGMSSSSEVEPGPECGNGELDPGEECDEGDANANYNACTGQCTLNVCGDGMRYEGVEACDLGPANGDGDDDQCGGCVAESCTLGPHCGDGKLDIACGELCDGDDSPMQLPCARTCRFDDAKLVFITPVRYSGDITAYTEHPVSDGIDAADWICHDLALEAGLFDPPADDAPPLNTPKFRAWLSSAMSPVNQRLDSDHAGIYVQRNGVVIANGWAGLTSGALIEPITVGPEPGQDQIHDLVWTNTRPNGDLNQADLACVDWMDDVNGYGAVGFSNDVEAWTYLQDAVGQLTCNNLSRLYCVEQ